MSADYPTTPEERENYVGYLRDVQTHKLAFVPAGANGRPFLLVKSANGGIMLDQNTINSLYGRLGRLVTLSKSGQLSPAAAQAARNELALASREINAIAPLGRAQGKTPVLQHIATIKSGLQSLVGRVDLSMNDHIEAIQTDIDRLAAQVEALPEQPMAPAMPTAPVAPQVVTPPAATVVQPQPFQQVPVAPQVAPAQPALPAQPFAPQVPGLGGVQLSGARAAGDAVTSARHDAVQVTDAVDQGVQDLNAAAEAEAGVVRSPGMTVSQINQQVTQPIYETMAQEAAAKHTTDAVAQGFGVATLPSGDQQVAVTKSQLANFGADLVRGVFAQFGMQPPAPAMAAPAAAAPQPIVAQKSVAPMVAPAPVYAPQPVAPVMAPGFVEVPALSHHNGHVVVTKTAMPIEQAQAMGLITPGMSPVPVPQPGAYAQPAHPVHAPAMAPAQFGLVPQQPAFAAAPAPASPADDNGGFSEFDLNVDPEKNAATQ